jgi:hypothetical protein
MKDTNNTAGKIDVSQLQNAHDALRVCFTYGRSVMQAASSLDSIAYHNKDRVDGDARKVEDLTHAASLVQTIAESAQEVADTLPTLRALASAHREVSPITDAGCAILVRFRKPTGASGPKWLATYVRDASTTFRASSSFTYEDKDKDGADVAAARCLAKFDAYCNDLPEGDSKFTLPKVTHRLKARASLGGGQYCYTFTRA